MHKSHQKAQRNVFCKQNNDKITLKLLWTNERKWHQMKNFLWQNYLSFKLLGAALVAADAHYYISDKSTDLSVWDCI